MSQRDNSMLDAAFQSWVEKHCRSLWGAPVDSMNPLEADGSSRRFFRVRSGRHALIALDHPDGRPGGTGENDACVAIGRHLERRGIPVPSIFSYNRGRGWIIQEDLGDLNLQKAISTASSQEEILSLYGSVLDVLVDLQTRGCAGFEDEWCYQGKRYDMRTMLDRESGYFLKAFVKGFLGWSGVEGPLEKEFLGLARAASEAPSHFLIHRDFQSRNLLFPSFGSPHVIDFQGARWGPLQYDVAALILDPYVSLTSAIREKILARYLEVLEASSVMHCEDFLRYYPVITLHRNLQILGAFAFLGHVRGKPFFLRWIPLALSHLRNLLEDHPEFHCPHLRELVDEAQESVSALSSVP